MKNSEKNEDATIKGIKKFGTWQIILSLSFILFSIGILVQELFWPGGDLKIGAFFAIITFGYILYLLIFLLFAGVLLFRLSAFGREISQVIFIYIVISQIFPLPLNLLSMMSLPWMLLVIWPIDSLADIGIIAFYLCLLTILISSIIYLGKDKIKEKFLPKKVIIPGSGIFWGIMILIGPLILMLANFVLSSLTSIVIRR